jgi:hypothetical protein
MLTEMLYHFQERDLQSVPQQIYSLWNGPKLPFIKASFKMVKYLSFNALCDRGI